MSLRLTLLGAALAIAAGCGGGGGAGTGGKGPAPDGGTTGCEPGEATDDAGGCVRAGVPENGCAPGFTSKDDACVAVLPDAPCPAGQMAVPGEAGCRDVAACAPGTWGDIPVDASTVYVDAAYAGGNSDGSQAHPYTTIAQAIAAAKSGGLVAIAQGAYVEDLPAINKKLRIWGRCPSLVSIEASASPSVYGALHFGPAAGGSEAHGLALLGASDGVFVENTAGLVLDQLWIHGTAQRGLEADDTTGKTSVTLSRSLIEGSGELGVFAYAADVTLDASVVRSTHTLGDPQDVEGIAALTDGKRQATVTIKGSVIEDNEHDGILAHGSSVTLTGSVVRATKAAKDKTGGVGIWAESAPESGNMRSTLTIAGSVVEKNRLAGIQLTASDLQMDTSVVRDTDAQPSDNAGGYGLQTSNPGGSKGRATAVIHASVFERNRGAGIVLYASDGTVESSVLRDNLPLVSKYFGFGLAANYAVKARSTVTIRASRVERNTLGGLFIVGSDATIEATVVRDTLPGALDQKGGRGIVMQPEFDSGSRANGTIKGCLVENNIEIGIFVGASDATIADTIVRGTLARAADGLLGDGLCVFTDGPPATATVDRSRIEGNARAGVLDYSGDITVSDSTLECNDIHLDGETGAGLAAFQFHASGKNACGCKGASASCVVATTMAVPPTY